MLLEFLKKTACVGTGEPISINLRKNLDVVAGSDLLDTHSEMGALYNFSNSLGLIFANPINSSSPQENLPVCTDR